MDKVVLQYSEACLSQTLNKTGLSGYLLLQFWSYSFNILYDVYTHNGGVHDHRILMVRREHHLLRRLLKETRKEACPPLDNYGVIFLKMKCL
jgi:hypothetical protein